MKRVPMIQNRLAAIVGAALTSAALMTSVSAQTRPTQKPSPQAAQAPNVKEWPDYAGSPEGNRYVALNQITKANVGKLEVAWSYPYAETGFNPIVAHGIVYTKARNKSIVA